MRSNAPKRTNSVWAVFYFWANEISLSVQKLFSPQPPIPCSLFALIVERKQLQTNLTMTKEYYSKEDQDSSSSTPFLTPSTPSTTTRSKKRHKSYFLIRHRIFTLSLITLLSTIIFTIHFNIPSTLWIYLTTVLILLPISILHELISLISSRGNLKVWWTRNRTIWISLELFGLCLLCLPQLSYPTSFTRSSLSLGNSWSRSGGAGATDYPQKKQTFFISANLFQSQDILPKFTSNLFELSEILGRENVFISIYESNSVDQTKRLLKDFEAELSVKGIRHKIVSDDVGEHVEAGSSEKAGRIKMLAHARNKAQSAFYEASESGRNGSVGSKDDKQSSTDLVPTPSSSNTAMKFDKVIWLNDIVFEPKDVLELIRTNGGEFDQACGIDFVPLGFYDTWVARSSTNDRLKPLWPYFSSPNDVERLRRNLPIEVNSCWNGMTAFDAKWFYANHTATSSTISTSTAIDQSTSSPSSSIPQAHLRSSNEVRSDHGMNKMNKVVLKKRKIQMESNSTAPEPAPLPLRFRTSQRCYSSECLLVSYDLHRAMHPEGRRPKILINPNVRVAYTHNIYYLYAKLMRSNIVAPWHLFWEDIISNRLFGWITELGRKTDKCKEIMNLWAPPPPVIPLEPEFAVEKV